MNREPLRYWAYHDGASIAGFDWYCVCGEVLRFALPEEVCECGFVLPKDDPQTWHQEQKNKRASQRDWNIIKREQRKKMRKPFHGSVTPPWRSS